MWTRTYHSHAWLPLNQCLKLTTTMEATTFPMNLASTVCMLIHVMRINLSRMSADRMLPGDEETRASLEQQVADWDPSSYWSAEHLSLSAIAAANIATKKPPPTDKPLYNPHEGDHSGRQLAESIPEFLSRLPPLTTTADKIGPWIWIANPYSPAHPLSQDLGAFTTAGTQILESLSADIAAQETALVGRPQTLLSRQLTQLRNTATEKLLNTARDHGVTTGKWMLFPRAGDVNRVWELVAEATANGHLGSGAKVATDTGLEASMPRLICVYTKDFSIEKVQPVLKKLAEMGLVHKTGDPRGIYYKCGE